MKSITHRNQFPELLKSMGLTGDAVEVGVAEAYNAWNILDNWGGRLHLVDPYRILDTPGFSGHGEATNADQEARYQRIIRQAQKYGPRCVVIRATSEEAVKRFADGSLDFSYLDGNHILEEVRKDIRMWWSKIKPNGILSGHDHLDGMVHGVDYGVKTAVLEFFGPAGFNLPINVTLENDYPSWYVQKI